jgi:hypothetical protein
MTGQCPMLVCLSSPSHTWPSPPPPADTPGAAATATSFRSSACLQHKRCKVMQQGIEGLRVQG